MTCEMEEFFRKLKDPNFLAMKLLYDVFKQMSSCDEESRSIVENIGVLSEYNIRMVDSQSMYNYVYTEDDLSEVKFAISKAGQKYVVAHEFGHLLLDLFSEKQLPDNYLIVNSKVRKRLLKNKKEVKELLFEISEYLYQRLNRNVHEPIEFINRNQFVVDEYQKSNNGGTYDDLINEAVGDYFCFMSSFDMESVEGNLVGNIIDSSFHGNNPFIKSYGRSDFYPLISCHDKEYFHEEDTPEFTGFEEQFAEYLVIRLFSKELGVVEGKLRELIGNEWFDMMDKYYKGIVQKIKSQKKVYCK